jgi:protein-S-isoprenylcysteine O-methyltransferase Ste14
MDARRDMMPTPPASGVPQPPQHESPPPFSGPGAKPSGGSEPKPSTRKDWGTVIVVVLGLLMSFGVLLALPIGFFGPVIILGGGMFVGLMAFHYLVWGRWLTRIIEQERAAENDNK